MTVSSFDKFYFITYLKHLLCTLKYSGTLQPLRGYLWIFKLLKFHRRCSLDALSWFEYKSSPTYTYIHLIGAFTTYRQNTGKGHPSMKEYTWLIVESYVLKVLRTPACFGFQILGSHIHGPSFVLYNKRW